MVFKFYHIHINVFQSGLKKVGWQEDTDIVPQGWMKKQIVMTKANKSSIESNKYKFISPNFKEFNSLATVYHYMRANSYPIEVVGKIRENLDVKATLSNKRMTSKGNVSRTYKWQQAKYLPPGWKVAEKKLRYGRKKNLYLSPNGLLIQKAVLAFQVMVEDEADNYYLGQMYQQLSKEGWEEDTSLPYGWRLNVDTKQFPDSFTDEEELEVLFLTEKGQILTRSKAVNLITSSDEFDDDQVSDFLGLVDNLDNGFERGWKVDPALPVGWKIKKIDLSFKKELHVMTSDQEEFDSVCTAFIYMMNNQALFKEEDLFKMKAKLSEEGFEDNEKLPSGWRIIRNRGENLFELLSREGVLYQTLNAAQEFMEDSEAYDEKHALEIEELCMAEVEAYLNNRVITNPSFGKFALGVDSEASPEKVKSGKRKRESGSNVGRKRKHAN